MWRAAHDLPEAAELDQQMLPTTSHIAEWFGRITREVIGIPRDTPDWTLGSFPGTPERARTTVGVVICGITAYLTVRFLVHYFETRTLRPFAIYSLVAGAASPIRFAVWALRRAAEPLRGSRDPPEVCWLREI